MLFLDKTTYFRNKKQKIRYFHIEILQIKIENEKIGKYKLHVFTRERVQNIMLKFYANGISKLVFPVREIVGFER